MSNNRLDARAAAEARQRMLTKPPGSLGRLEQLAVRLAGLQGRERPGVDRVHIAVFAADHGIAADGVSAFPQAVTAQMVANFAAGGAAISVMARVLGATLEVVDVGVLPSASSAAPLPGVHRRAIGAGTRHLAREAAIRGSELDAALAAGAESVERACDAGAELYVGGEMGIGNTTSATALACALLNHPAHVLAGPGTGLDSSGVARKAALIEAAMSLHRPALEGLAPSARAREALRRVGGFEIAALAGAYMAAARRGLPVLVDGYIATAAALAACGMAPDTREYLLFAHRSAEPGHDALLLALEADPLLELGLRLGEGSGAAAAIPLLRLACALHDGMATFAEAGVAAGEGS